jgi:hypothetical protein
MTLDCVWSERPQPLGSKRTTRASPVSMSAGLQAITTAWTAARKQNGNAMAL